MWPTVGKLTTAKWVVKEITTACLNSIKLGFRNKLKNCLSSRIRVTLLRFSYSPVQRFLPYKPIREAAI